MMPFTSAERVRVKLFGKEGMILILLCSLIVAVYFPSLGGEFILDDKPFVKDNPSVHELQSPAAYLLQEDGIIGEQTGRTRSGYYRPLTNASYSLDFRIWGGKAPGFRATNLALHMVTCLLLYLCLSTVLKRRMGALLAVVLFSLHPVQTESVSWVASRNNILVTLFSLAALHFYVRRVEEGKAWLGGLSLLSFALALLSKEFGVMVLAILFAYDRIAAAGTRPLRMAIWGYLAYLAIFCAYLALRSTAIDALIPEQRSMGTFLQALTYAPFLIMENLRIILFPVGLHNFMTPYPAEGFGLKALLGMTGTLAYSWLAWRWRANRIVCFSMVSFVLALLPVLNLVPTSAYSLVSMRWLYFPMALLSFGAAWGLNRLGARRRFLGYAGIGAVAAYLGGYTFVMNETLWKEEQSFFEREVNLFGNVFYAGDLARSLHLSGDYPLAERYYRMALGSRSPHRQALLTNYAALLVESGRPDEALRYLEYAERPSLGKEDRAAIFNNKGAAYLKMGDHARAIQAFQKALVFAPCQPSYLANLAYAYRQTGEFGKAEEAYNRYLEILPNTVEIRKKGARKNAEMGDMVKADNTLDGIPEEVRSRDGGIQDLSRPAPGAERAARSCQVP